MNTILNVENIVKTYGKKINIKRALNHIQFSVMEGEFVRESRLFSNLKMKCNI